MRSLFVSENRCIENLFRLKWQDEAYCPPTVLSETISRPQNANKKSSFNCDFILDFVDWRASGTEREAAACSILPNALGAELFLIVEKSTLMLTALELNGGYAFSIKDFANYIEHVEQTIQAAIGLVNVDKPRSVERMLAQSLPLHSSSFARVLVVGRDVTFLFSPTETIPVMRGHRLPLVQSDDQEIHVYVDGGQILCIDGWVRASITSTTEVLVSMPE
jgi:hypothetical protein